MSFVAVSAPLVANPYRRKLQKIWSVVAGAVFTVLAVSAGVAYFVSQRGAPARPSDASSAEVR